MMKLTSAVVALAVGPALMTHGALQGQTSAAGQPGPPAIIDLSEDLNPALNDPDRFSWEILAAISWRVSTGPDSANEVHFETWSTDTRTFPPSPRPSTCMGTNADNPENCATWPGSDFVPDRRMPLSQAATAGLALPKSAEERGEVVYRNRENFDYIVDNDLWYLEGLSAKVSTDFEVRFPIGAVTVKSHWEHIEEAEKGRFHWGVDPDGQLWGLTALHVISRQLPIWTWSTFEHVDNLGRCDFIGCHDSFGQIPPDIPPNPDRIFQSYSGDVQTPELSELLAAAGVPAVFENYRLKGTQNTFVDSNGLPTLLGNSQMEFAFLPASSCVTCHGRSAINEHGQFLSFFEYANGSSFTGTDTTPAVVIPADTHLAKVTLSNDIAGFVAKGEIGAPNPLWFQSPTLLQHKPGGAPALQLDSGLREFMTLDFNWGFFKANNIAE